MGVKNMNVRQKEREREGETERERVNVEALTYRSGDLGHSYDLSNPQFFTL